MPRWSYSREARRKRDCDECGTRLTKDEVVLCGSCFVELLDNTVYLDEDQTEIEEETEREEDEE